MAFVERYIILWPYLGGSTVQFTDTYTLSDSFFMQNCGTVCDP